MKVNWKFTIIQAYADIEGQQLVISRMSEIEKIRNDFV